MLFQNGYIFTEEGKFVFGGFEVENGRFLRIFQGKQSGKGENLSGSYVIPGLVDIHIHGSMGEDFSDGNYTGLCRIASYLASHGITSFLPASMSLSYQKLSLAFQTAKKLKEEKPAGCAEIAGIHMEGPFLSEKKRGAQNRNFLKEPDYEAFKKLYEDCGGLIRIVDVAPELPGAAEFVKTIPCIVSAAHTNSDYETAKTFFEAGASHITHLFNAMPPIHHRNPGVIGAASEQTGVTAELICDGLHVHPSAVRMAFKLFPGHICLISDALRCCGMPDGTYESGGQKIILCDGAAKLPDGTLAGSVTNLYDGMRNAVAFGIDKEEAVRAATMNPAEAIGLGGKIGKIAEGRNADFVVCDRKLERKSVYLGGVQIK